MTGMKWVAWAGIAVSLCSPGIVFARAGWTDYAVVAELTPTVQGRFVLDAKVSENPSGCRDKDSFYRDYGLPGADSMFRALLEALTTGKKVRLSVTGNCDINGYSEIDAVTVVP